jgi:hypothetical protein
MVESLAAMSEPSASLIFTTDPSKFIDYQALDYDDQLYRKYPAIKCTARVVVGTPLRT